MNPYPLENSRILIIDDARAPRKILKKLLSDFGNIEYFEVEKISDALKILEIKKFNLIFCDHHLPDGNSLKLLSWIAKNELNKITPVVLISSDFTKETLIEGRKLGAINFLAKPFNKEDLSRNLVDTMKWQGRIKDYYNSRINI